MYFDWSIGFCLSEFFILFLIYRYITKLSDEIYARDKKMEEANFRIDRIYQILMDYIKDKSKE